MHLSGLETVLKYTFKYNNNNNNNRCLFQKRVKITLIIQPQNIRTFGKKKLERGKLTFIA